MYLATPFFTTFSILLDANTETRLRNVKRHSRWNMSFCDQSRTTIEAFYIKHFGKDPVTWS